ncbi:hypothetical protein H0H92_001677, partial [Tricholoma furcatifolium]
MKTGAQLETAHSQSAFESSFGKIYEHHFSNDADQNFETNLQTRTRYKPVDRK